jgi:hypothetical protein
MEPALQHVEDALGAMVPVALSADLSSRYLGIVSRVPFPLDDKVVLFPGKSRSGQKPAARRPWWMAAAAVAMAGAFSATFVGHEGSSSATKEVASAEMISSPPVQPQVNSAEYSSPASPGNFVPASTGTGVQEAKDEGVVWNRQGNPFRMVRVVYMDTVKLKDGNGKIVEVQRPRVDYLAVPEKVN